ncbi:MAG: FAD-dependent oxidoreductase [Microthrixaceae bacterium]
MVGAGLGGFATAVVAATGGANVVLLERGDRFGGAAAYSGGQVWVGANHVAAAEGSDDSVEQTLRYIAELAAKEPSVFEPERSAEWVDAARIAAQWFSDQGVIEWTVIPEYPDYYHPDVEGARPWGRYLTGAPFDGARLGEWRTKMLHGPHFPSGLTYTEMFEFGGLSRRAEFATVLEQRRHDDVMTYGQGIIAAFATAAHDLGVDLRLGTSVTELLVEDGRVVGVRAEGPEGVAELRGPVVLATGSHDWSSEISRQVTGLEPDDAGSVAPDTLHGDHFALAEQVGAQVRSIPAWAAPVLPGYRLATPAFEGDTGFRPCYEHCVPHTFIVNRDGERFCDDSFHPSIVAAALRGDAEGRSNVPMFMIWDEQHHQKYGLGATPPGGEYPDGLVASASTLEELADRLGIDAAGLEPPAGRFNAAAANDEDPEFGRGSNASVRRFRGDNNAPHPNIAPVDQAPFFGMRLRLLNTGIASGGLRTTDHGKVLAEDGDVIPGLYAVGECAVRSTGGGGYNSGYSLSRAMTFGWLAANDILGAS